MRVEGFTAETQSQAGLGTSMGNGVLEYWSVGGDSGKCGKVRIIARKSAKVHESSHRSGPWLRDCSHCYGWDSFFGDWRFLTDASDAAGDMAGAGIDRGLHRMIAFGNVNG